MCGNEGAVFGDDSKNMTLAGAGRKNITLGAEHIGETCEVAGARLMAGMQWNEDEGFDMGEWKDGEPIAID